MNIQAEVSLYPLRTNELGAAIKSFNDILENAGLTVRQETMSTKLAGDADQLFAALGKAFEHAADGYQVVLTLKASNACPETVM